MTLLVVITQAQERELPKFRLGGALRFNYNFCDWKPGHRDRGGDFGFDVLYFKLSGSYRNILLSADYRFYSNNVADGESPKRLADGNLADVEIRVDRLPIQR